MMHLVDENVASGRCYITNCPIIIINNDEWFVEPASDAADAQQERIVRDSLGQNVRILVRDMRSPDGASTATCSLLACKHWQQVVDDNDKQQQQPPLLTMSKCQVCAQHTLVVINL